MLINYDNMEKYMYDPLMLAESLGLKETSKYRYLIYADSPLYFVVQRYNKELRAIATVTLSKELFERMSNDDNLKNQIITAWNVQFDLAEQRLLQKK